ncbi:MAG: hypothetical protein EAX96_19930 [Candidatus Lokiarchaeota archaeon]|nr:hypothetical protein [Candidatus Lokiarchaeota archaeon]
MINDNEMEFKNLYKKFLPSYIDLVKFLEVNLIQKENVFFLSQTIILNLLRHQLLKIDIDKEYEFEKITKYKSIIEKINSFFSCLNLEQSSNFIGTLFENLLHVWDEKRSENEPELISKRLTQRKVRGVFYTPSNITKYMVERVISKIIFERLNINHEKFSSLFLLIENLSNEVLKDINNILINLKIFDPACGSGAFLLESANFIFKIREKIAKKLSLDIKSFDLKKEIIENNLYGVDIYPNAIEIIKLRFLFWINIDFEFIDLLNFNKNLKIGNSLYEFNWSKEFKEIFYSHDEGFDIIISNPPYGRTILTGQQDNLKHYLVTSNEYAKKTSYNATSLFLELGFNLLNSRGHLTMIVPSSVARTEEFEGIRKFILEKSDLYELVDKGKAFPDVTLEMIIIFLRNSKIKGDKVKIISERDRTTRFIEKEVFKKYERFILYHDRLFEILMNNSQLNIIHSRSGVDHRLIKYKHKKDQIKEKNENYTIPFLHSGKSIQRYHLDSSQFNYIREKNLSLKRFKQEYDAINIVTVAISPFIRATIKKRGMIPGTNIQVINIDTSALDVKNICYYLALLNSKLLRVFFHVYIQNKIQYTFKIQDYHTKFYPIKLSKDDWIFILFARILTKFYDNEEFREFVQKIDNLLDYLVIDLYLQEEIGSNLTEIMKKFLKENKFDNFKQYDENLIKELILKISDNQLINKEIKFIKEKLILDEKELEIKILNLGCNFHD